jgi:ATP adenylyltransferase
MQQPLWAPWRMAFIEQPKPTGCIFCDFPNEEGEEAERRNLLVHRGPRSFTLLNKFPYNSGHVMVIPRAHVSTLEALAPEDFTDLHDELRRASQVVRDVYRPEGMNVGMNLGKIAGAGIADHLHYHVVPRWGGDTNFMPVVADTRVMVEHLDQSWAKLRDGFRARFG